MKTNHICFALDVPTAKEAQHYVNLLEDHVGAFKVGLELFIATGELPKTKKPIVLDLKLHDIPETVTRAIAAAGARGVKYMTMHIQQEATVRAAVKEAESFGITLFGVTVLTSMAENDCIDLLMPSSVGTDLRPSYFTVTARAAHLASKAYGWGLRGFVCSPREVGALSDFFPLAKFLVPGVRPAGANKGDQQRTGTPEQAVMDGADLIVIGRPIRDAANPVQAAIDILAELPE